MQLIGYAWSASINVSSVIGAISIIKGFLNNYPSLPFISVVDPFHLARSPIVSDYQYSVSFEWEARFETGTSVSKHRLHVIYKGYENNK
jgi:hypothetical protein